MLISAVVLTKNEEGNIKKCLESLKWCDEIIVIDDYSDDLTAIVAESEGVKVFLHVLENDFAGQRNFGLGVAKGEWVLFIDADERVPQSLIREIKFHISLHRHTFKTATTHSKFRIQGYYMKRRDYMWGKELKHGETGNIKLLRLAKRDSGRWVGKVHEVWNVKGKLGELENAIVHYPHQSMVEFLSEINYYTDIRAEELFHQKVRVRWWDIIIYPKAKFIMNYFLRAGFLDGIEGLILAIAMSFHSFLVRGKLWQLWDQK